MTTCKDFTILLHNRAGVEIRATKLEYLDENKSKNENIFGLDGSDSFNVDEKKEYTRNLQGIEDESTTFTVTYQHRLTSGNNWSGNHTASKSLNNCVEGGSIHIDLTD